MANLGGHRFDRTFICVKYPGNVINPDKAIETLGGLGAISTAVDTSNRRLELRFRPDDGYCKPACGDRHNTTAFLLKVTIKKSRVNEVIGKTQGTNNAAVAVELADMDISSNNDTSIQTKVNKTSVELNQKFANNSEMMETECLDHSLTELVDGMQNCNTSSKVDLLDFSEKKETNSKLEPNCLPNCLRDDKKNIRPIFDNKKYEDLSKSSNYELPKVKILGKVETEFRFTNLCDFQYLPLANKKSNPQELECIYNAIYPRGIMSYTWLKNDVPYFLPPAAFSRMDTMQQYVPKTEVDSLPENIIGKNRKRRKGFSNFISFNNPDVPTVPPKGIETAMKIKFLQNTHLEKIQKLFDERPIWSKNALIYHTKFTSEQLKILLPCVAYYFMTGPWRIMWVRLGYDPRQDTSARIYQTLDYRLKAMHGLGNTVKCKRNYAEYTLPYKSGPVSKPKTSILTTNINLEQNCKKERHLNDNIYLYREGYLPPSRQMFYQYCDVQVDEIQEMLAKLPDPLPGTKCDEKLGWLPSAFGEQCREIINKHVRAVLRKQMNIPEDHPTSLPRKRKSLAKHRLQKALSKTQKRDPLDSESELLTTTSLV
ncbi:general transcription factor 3C polypeptide 5 isoform X2 [Prorops nasuta]|uniref:general transcription factor 3C polypeptide 5 isoform X2 n=1 Tax=Prorops nasuta TaxID=863751 RepID=UPI0034CEFA42